MSSQEKDTSKKLSLKPSRKVAVTIAVIVAIAATVFASILTANIPAVTLSVNGAAVSVMNVLFGGIDEGAAGIISTITIPILIIVSCAISCALVYYILRVCKANKKSAALLSLIPVIAPVVLSFVSGGFGTATWLMMAIAVIFVVALVLFDHLKEKYPKFFKSLAIAYIFFGVLTTIVSFVTKMIFYSYNWHTFFAVTVSWIITVIFAYIVNKLFVFKSDTETKEELFREMLLFFGMRLVSWLIEVLFLLITVDWIGWAEAPCVLAVQVVILVSNFFFSKLKVFVKVGENAEKKPEKKSFFKKKKKDDA